MKLVWAGLEQVTRCHEARCYELLLRGLDAMPSGVAGAELREAASKPFRLAVKRRLNKKHEESLKALADSTGRKAELERLYQVLSSIV